MVKIVLDKVEFMNSLFEFINTNQNVRLHLSQLSGNTDIRRYCIFLKEARFQEKVRKIFMMQCADS